MHNKLLLLTIALLLTAMANAQTYLQKDDGNSGLSNSVVYEDADGNVGIGTTAPEAQLHISRFAVYNTSQPPPDFFSLSSTVPTGNPQSPTLVTHSNFIVKGNGNVGIGTADPQATLHVQTNTWMDANDPDMGKPMMIFSDPDENLLGGFFNPATGTGQPTNGTFLVFSEGSSIPAFAVVNKSTQRLPMAVMGDGTVAMGIDVSNGFNVQAQINITKSNNYSYLLKLQNANQSEDYFTVHNDGFVGIGTANSGNSTLEIVSHDDNIGITAAVSIVGASSTPRFLYAGNSSTIGSNTSTYLSVKSTGTGIGTDDLSHGSTLAVKGNATNGTNIDLFDLTSDPQDQMSSTIRFLNATGTLIHTIAADNDALHIYPNQNTSTNANKKLKVAGNEEVSLNLQVGGDVDIDGRVKIGNVSTPCAAQGFGNCYSLYVEKGILAERFRCAIKTSGSWSDYVFDKNHKLMSLADLEKYVNKNHHLPEIPSANEVVKEGIDLGEMNAKLLAKIEEITLHVIDQQKQIDQLKKRR